MENKTNTTDRIVQTVQQELTERYDVEEDIRELILSMQEYKSLPITTPNSEHEVSLVLEDVVLITKEKTLRNGEKIPVYELFGENGIKILETQDDGMMKFDKEIFDDLIKSKIKAIEDAGYEVAGVNTMDESGKIESFFELINGKVTAINKHQKERIDNAEDRASVMEDINGETSDPDIETSEISDNEQSMQNEQQVQEQMSKDLGFSIFQMTKVDDPIFRMNNPQTRGNDLYVVYTHSGEVQFVTGSDWHDETMEGFKNSGRASGRTTRILNDEDSLEDNEINTYGEIYPTNRDDIRYTIERGQYGEIKLVEQVRYEGNKMSETDKWISREVETSNTNYLDKNREGAENSKNITARTFNRSSTNTDANKYGSYNGKGGLSEVGKTMKNNKPTRTNMESLAADENQRYDEAKKMVVDAANKTGASLDPDTEAAIDKRVRDIVDYMNEPFTEDIAEQVLIEVKMQIAEQKRANTPKPPEEDDYEQEEGRSRLDEEFQRKMNKR